MEVTIKQCNGGLDQACTRDRWAHACDGVIIRQEDKGSSLVCRSAVWTPAVQICSGALQEHGNKLSATTAAMYLLLHAQTVWQHTCMSRILLYGIHEALLCLAGTLSLYGVSGRRDKLIKAHKGAVTSLQWSFDGKSLRQAVALYLSKY